MTNATSGSDKTPSFEKTWGSSASSGYCSGEEEEDSGFEQYFTARTSFFPQTRKAKVEASAKQVRKSPAWLNVDVKREVEQETVQNCSEAVRFLFRQVAFLLLK